MNKKIYLEPSWRMHSFYKELISHPPQGYEFITRQTYQEKAYDTLTKVGLGYFLTRKVLNRLAPLNLVKAYLEMLRKIPEGTELTYAVNHLVFRKEPWVADCEYVATLIGGDINHLERFSRVVERALSTTYCKSILCWHEVAKKSLILNLNCTDFEHKIKTVSPAVPKKNFTKDFKGNKVKLLFVNSSNISGQFERKGGNEVLEAFVRLNKKFDNLELVVRSDMPRGVKNKYRGIPNLRVIDRTIPWETLEQEFQSADIFLMPAHVTPYQAFLDTMSYELPIITIDAWANPEIVEDSKTGFVVKKSECIKYYTESFLPNWDTPKFLKAIQTPDPEVVNRLVEKTSILIENPELRRQMGKAARWEIEHGKFSIERRNEKLKRIFDEATAKNIP